MSTMQKVDTRLSSLAQLLEKQKGSLSAIVANGLKPDRLIKIAIGAASKNPKILECSPITVYRAITEAAQLGLEAGGPLGHAYLVPYGNQCQLIVSYKGMIDLARRSGQILSIEARVVYAGDEFDYQYGLEPKCRHVPKAVDLDDAKITHAYAVAHLVGGGTQFEVMTRAQIESIRSKSRSGSSGPWRDHFAEMSKKSAVRRLFKYLPISIETADAFAKEDVAEGVTVDAVVIPPIDENPDGEPIEEDAVVSQTTTEKIKSKLGGE